MYLIDSKIIEYYPNHIISDKEQWKKSNLTTFNQKKFKKSIIHHSSKRHPIRNQSKSTSFNIGKKTLN